VEAIFSSLVKDFVDETRPFTQEVSGLLLKLEEVWRAGGDGASLLRGIRSGLHTIKGNGAMMGFTPIERVAHALEDICPRVSDEPPADPTALVQILIEGCDVLDLLVTSATAGELPTERADAYVARVAEAQASARAAPAPSPTGAGARNLGSQNPPPAIADADGAHGGARIAEGDVDELLELVGETIVGQTELARVHGRFARGQFESGDVALMDRLLLDLGRTTRQMRDQLLRVRLAPIATLFGRFHRYVRDLARERGQGIELVIEGGETAIDRAIIRRLFEPLVHLVRNCVAHGIEPADERLAAGKATGGRIVLGAVLREGRVNVRVADDGRGLDLQAIAAKARSQGIDTEGLGEQQIQRLIFQAGFSTAKVVTNLAGRGVGLDVVAGAVQGLGGSIDVRSTPGQGAAFVLDLPVTVSLQKALIFGVDAEIFAIPAGFILDTMESREKDLQEINRVLLISWRGDFLRAADAGRLLGCQGLAQAWARPYAVVLQAGNNRGAILVDWLSGVQEIVVKPLDDSLAGCHLLAGATVLAQGRVVPILDCMELVRRVGKAWQPAPSAETSGEATYDVF
jgi:two-component system, chemotaxis family, sensor kinase CheA